MTNELFTQIIQAAGVALVGLLGYMTALWRTRAKTAEREVEREHQAKDLAIQKSELDMERTRLELRLQTERAENEKAIREAMMLSMKRVASLEEVQEKQAQELGVTKDQYTQAKDMIDDLQAQIIGRDRESAKRSEEIKRLTSESAALTRRLDETEAANQAERRKLQEVIDAKDREIERLRAENQMLKAQLSDVRKELDDVQKRLAMVEHKPSDPPPANGMAQS